MRFDGSSATLWPLTDHLNTVRGLAVCDAETGVTTIANHLVYDAFGRVTSQSDPAVMTLFGFTARPFDRDTGLQNNLNRWYDAETGTWISEDLKGFAAADANLYRYVGNVVTMVADPSGCAAPPNNPYAGRPFGGNVAEQENARLGEQLMTDQRREEARKRREEARKSKPAPSKPTSPTPPSSPGWFASLQDFGKRAWEWAWGTGTTVAPGGFTAAAEAAPDVANAIIRRGLEKRVEDMERRYGPNHPYTKYAIAEYEAAKAGDGKLKDFTRTNPPPKGYTPIYGSY